MASGGRVCLLDAGSLQYVVDQLCGRVLRVFGDKPAVEGGPFTLSDILSRTPRLVFRGPVGGAVHLVVDIIPWEVTVDATGDQPLITELRFRGKSVPGSQVFRNKSSFALTINCLGGKPFQAQWYCRLAVEGHGANPTRLTCVLSYFMKYIGRVPRQDGRLQSYAAERIATLLDYFGVKPDHLHGSSKSSAALKSHNPSYIRDGATDDEFFSVTVVAMLLCICKFCPSGDEDQGDGHDKEHNGAPLALLRALLTWPLQSTPMWGITIEGIDFFIEDGKLDLKMLRTSFEISFEGRRFRRCPFLSPHK